MFRNGCARKVLKFREFGGNPVDPLSVMQAKTRSLVARIDRLEAQIERQQKRDKAARLLAARSMLKRRQPHGLDGVTRSHKRIAQVAVFCFESYCTLVMLEFGFGDKTSVPATLLPFHLSFYFGSMSV